MCMGGKLTEWEWMCVCVCVCQMALDFLWLIRCPCAELGNSADSSQLARQGQNESHGDARRMTTHWATQESCQDSCCNSAHTQTHTHSHTYSFSTCFSLLPSVSWLHFIHLHFLGILVRALFWYHASDFRVLHESDVCDFLEISQNNSKHEANTTQPSVRTAKPFRHSMESSRELILPELV